MTITKPEKIKHISKKKIIQLNQTEKVEKVQPTKHVSGLTESYVAELMKKLATVKDQCGELCNTSRIGTPGPYFNHIHANIKCDSLINIKYMNTGHGLPKAPRLPPAQLVNEFRMNGRIPLKKWYFSQQYLGNKMSVLNWTEDMINKQIALARKGILPGTYGTSATNAVLDGMKHAGNIKNGHVLVIGSENPWVEACALSLLILIQ